MREILFRGKPVCSDDWVYGGIVHQTDYYGEPVERWYIIDGTDTQDYDIGPECRVKPDTVGQYTGWHDKHGAMILEDDIVFFPGDFKLDKGFFGRVVFRDGQWQIIWWNAPAYVQDLYTWTKRNEIAVVGNIYDNPELIGGK